MVSIQCCTYNQEAYIRQCLEGFVMQKTDFPFEAIVHDDASTDGTAAIIREYAEKYPDIIKPIYESENQYSKKDGSLRRIMIGACIGKYTALCEGDDFWIDPLKLQKQVDFLEAHTDYTMCCSDAKIVSGDKELDWHRYEHDCDVSVKDMVMGGGMFLPTCTLVFRRELRSRDVYPDCCKQCHVGDYPLQIWAALQGKVRYFAEKTGAYRQMASGSWSERNRHQDLKPLIHGWRSEINMLKGLDECSQGKYHKIFRQRQIKYLYGKCKEHIAQLDEIKAEFEDVYSMFSIWRRLRLLKHRVLD